MPRTNPSDINIQNLSVQQCRENLLTGAKNAGSSMITVRTEELIKALEGKDEPDKQHKPSDLRTA